MKCVVLSNVQGKRKSDGKPFSIATVAYLRNGNIEVQEKFGIENCTAGDIIDVDTDFKGYVLSYEVVGVSESVSYLTEDLVNLAVGISQK